MKFEERYPHGVLTEQEGGIPNDAYHWEEARHVCRKHRVMERVCADVPGQDGQALCPWCGKLYPAEETVWFVPERGTFACSENCARMMMGLQPR